MKHDIALQTLLDMRQNCQIEPQSIFMQDLINMLRHYEKTVKSLYIALNVIRENAGEEFMSNLQQEIDTYNDSFNYFSEVI